MHSNNTITIRQANTDDVVLILEFIQELASYEKLLHEVSATTSQLQKTLFEQHYAKVLLAEYNGKIAGMALYFHSYSTFLAKAGIYLEDLFVKADYRGLGIGKALLKQLARICVEQDFGRLEWSVLDWNQPSIDFYESLDAKKQSEWFKYRLEGRALADLATQ